MPRCTASARRRSPAAAGRAWSRPAPPRVRPRICSSSLAAFCGSWRTAFRSFSARTVWAATAAGARAGSVTPVMPCSARSPVSAAMSPRDPLLKGRRVPSSSGWRWVRSVCWALAQVVSVCQAAARPASSTGGAPRETTESRDLCSWAHAFRSSPARDARPLSAAASSRSPLCRVVARLAERLVGLSDGLQRLGDIGFARGIGQGGRDLVQLQLGSLGGPAGHCGGGNRLSVRGPCSR